MTAINQYDLPTLADVERIAALDDAVIRNLQITQCYHELSIALAGRIAPGANWCTFATWASKQAGQTIRQEDLKRLLERRLHTSVEIHQASQSIASSSNAAALRSDWLGEILLKASTLSRSLDLASQAVGRGNLKVFAEIGREFARFCATCLDDPDPEPEKIDGFCQELRDGEPPDGQRYLRQAFNHYYQARFSPSEKARAELILLANLEIGVHEQNRLQPEIAESLDAALISSEVFTRQLLAELYPSGGWLVVWNLLLRRLLGRPTRLDQAMQTVAAVAGKELREIITETMMTITLPGQRRLRLGEDLQTSYPDVLKILTLAELRDLLVVVDPTPDNPIESGALDWADLPDRMHFIAELFRCYQEDPYIFEPPFTTAQTDEIKAGRLPDGEL
jgi:hypothetical protein